MESVSGSDDRRERRPRTKGTRNSCIWILKTLHGVKNAKEIKNERLNSKTLLIKTTREGLGLAGECALRAVAFATQKRLLVLAAQSRGTQSKLEWPPRNGSGGPRKFR
ncbi:hypothetical protein EVAR_55262_1 [Eumeta japonica]|uniref:Uncharacterized protein n=1 Tax=Eumeta variegata TaxID=151549 RepID=A0A4C1Z637_EUMVA|nr:hypothetical protein EVAR_55262_1 [Eumeta japonica]